jgi:hypothetical protein
VAPTIGTYKPRATTASKEESKVTATFQASSKPSQPSLATRATIVIVATVGVFALIVAGITFFALAIASSIALPIAEQFQIIVKASDLEIARQLAGFVWLFIVATVASFFAAVVMTVKVIQRVSPAPTE